MGKTYPQNQRSREEEGEMNQSREVLQQGKKASRGKSQEMKLVRKEYLKRPFVLFCCAIGEKSKNRIRDKRTKHVKSMEK